MLGEGERERERGRGRERGRTLLLRETLQVLFAAVGVDLLFCEVVGAAAGDDEGAPADPVG